MADNETTAGGGGGGTKRKASPKFFPSSTSSASSASSAVENTPKRCKITPPSADSPDQLYTSNDNDNDETLYTSFSEAISAIPGTVPDDDDDDEADGDDESLHSSQLRFLEAEGNSQPGSPEPGSSQGGSEDTLVTEPEAEADDEGERNEEADEADEIGSSVFAGIASVIGAGDVGYGRGVKTKYAGRGLETWPRCRVCNSKMVWDMELQALLWCEGCPRTGLKKLKPELAFDG